MAAQVRKAATYGLVPAVVLDCSVLVTVPSDDWVTVFSFDLTVPSLLTLLVSL